MKKEELPNFNDCTTVYPREITDPKVRQEVFKATGSTMWFTSEPPKEGEVMKPYRLKLFDKHENKL